MKKIIFLVVFLVISNTTLSQSKKFSVDANYLYSIRDYAKIKGRVSGTFNYLFKETESSIYEISYSLDFLEYDDSFEGYFFYYDYYFNHINVSWKPKIINLKDTHIFTSTGYTLSIEKDLITNNNDFSEEKNHIDNGLNIKFGIQQYFSNSFFIQTYFHHIMSFGRSETVGNYTHNFNHLKFGLGFRF